MLKFNLGLFVKSLEELEGLPEAPGREERLKKIAVMVYEGRIDYDTFTFEEISEVYEHALQFTQYNPPPNNLFVQLQKPAVFAEKIFQLPRRREGHVFL
jgi:hypothetical protein